MELAGFDESPVLTSIRPVIDRVSSVLFHPEALQPAVEQWGGMLSSHSAWDHPCHYFDGTERVVRWIFVLDVLNHCFWPDKGEPTWTVTYRGEPYSGYWGLAASLKRAMEDGLPLTDSAYLEQIPAGDLDRIFSGEGKIPLFEKRLSNLREAGRALRSRWEGDAVRLVESAGGSAVRLARLVVDSFPSFQDEASYNGHTILFWKRAQIFAADLYHAFGGTRWGKFEDIERLTAFADYKLPQVLRELGVISYTPELALKVDSYQHLESGGIEEVEIRAATVWSVAALRDAFLQAGRSATSMLVDNWLWQLGQLEPFRRRPYHRCRTIYY